MPKTVPACCLDQLPSGLPHSGGLVSAVLDQSFAFEGPVCVCDHLGELGSDTMFLRVVLKEVLTLIIFEFS